LTSSDNCITYPWRSNNTSQAPQDGLEAVLIPIENINEVIKQMPQEVLDMRASSSVEKNLRTGLLIRIILFHERRNTGFLEKFAYIQVESELLGLELMEQVIQATPPFDDVFELVFAGFILLKGSDDEWNGSQNEARDFYPRHLSE
jgi:hypothetical protein